MQLTEADDDLIGRVKAALGSPPARLGVAVSGGGDSLALLHLLAKAYFAQNVQIEAVTVDHGLRAEAADEAELVRRQCSAMGIPHAIAHWTRWAGEGNLQSEARTARYRLISEWAKRRNLDVVCLGHTQGDVAETFLMRLGRESGVDGLARMADQFTRHEVAYRRPLLEISRQELRDFLLRHAIEWCDDPSNVNEAFDRVRARRALEVLSDLGLTAANLSKVAQYMGDARDVISRQTTALADSVVTETLGDLMIDRAGLMLAEPELRRRLLSAAIKWVGHSDYTPRRQGVSDLDKAVTEQRGFALGGCLITVNSKSLRIAREYNAVRDSVEHSPIWDRWQIDGPWKVGMQAKPLGEPEVAGLENWRDGELPRRSLMSSPAVWYKDELVAAPLANFGKGWSVSLRGGDFRSSMGSDCII